MEITIQKKGEFPDGKIMKIPEGVGVVDLAYFGLDYLLFYRDE